MKRFSLFLSVCILLLRSETTLAQTASDYYLPLSVGSHVKLYTAGGGHLGWLVRTTTYSIVGTDTIAGQKYFKEVGEEFFTTGPPHVFQVFWLRGDSVGNVVIGAINVSNGSTNIDSATIVGNGILLPNEFLAKGYSRTTPYGNQTIKDSVLSVTETVSVSAATFNNCLEISETHFDSNGTAVSREYDYYA